MSRRVRPAARALIVVTAAAAALGALGSTGCHREVGAASFDRPLSLGGQLITPIHLNRGADAFSHYCRPCHGAAGDGAGPAARGLRPPPRDLRLGVYKFAAVAAGQLPNDADFRRIIRGGLHGTAMLAWDLSAPELEDVIAYIKTLAPRWATEKAGEPIALAPDPFAGADDIVRDAAAIERGNRVYHGLAQCAVACHPAYATRPEIFAFTQQLTGMRVEDFRADLYAPVPKPSDYGYAIVPPDFTFNPLRAGETVDDIARTIASGVGGTAMPTWKNVLPDADLWAMAHYVRSLVELRGTPAADQLRAVLLTQPPFSPPPPPDAALPEGGADGGQTPGRDGGRGD